MDSTCFSFFLVFTKTLIFSVCWERDSIISFIILYNYLSLENICLKFNFLYIFENSDVVSINFILDIKGKRKNVFMVQNRKRIMM